MDSYGSLWIPKSSYGFLWIPKNSYGFPKDSYGFPLIPDGFLWIPRDSCGFLWIPREICGFLGIPCTINPGDITQQSKAANDPAATTANEEEGEEEEEEELAEKDEEINTDPSAVVPDWSGDDLNDGDGLANGETACQDTGEKDVQDKGEKDAKYKDDNDGQGNCEKDGRGNGEKDGRDNGDKDGRHNGEKDGLDNDDDEGKEEGGDDSDKGKDNDTGVQQEGEEEEHLEEDAEVEACDVDKGETDGPGNSEKAEPKSKSALSEAKLMDRESLEDKQARLLNLLCLARQKLHAKTMKLIFTLFMVFSLVVGVFNLDLLDILLYNIVCLISHPRMATYRREQGPSSCASASSSSSPAAGSMITPAASSDKPSFSLSVDKQFVYHCFRHTHYVKTRLYIHMAVSHLVPYSNFSKDGSGDKLQLCSNSDHIGDLLPD
jgi:hypothetical protein